MAGGCLWQFFWVDIWPIFHPFSAHISLAIFQVRLASNPIGQTFKLTFDCVGRQIWMQVCLLFVGSILRSKSPFVLSLSYPYNSELNTKSVRFQIWVTMPITATGTNCNCALCSMRSGRGCKTTIIMSLGVVNIITTWTTVILILIQHS